QTDRLTGRGTPSHVAFLPSPTAGERGHRTPSAPAVGGSLLVGFEPDDQFVPRGRDGDLQPRLLVALVTPGELLDGTADVLVVACRRLDPDSVLALDEPRGLPPGRLVRGDRLERPVGADRPGRPEVRVGQGLELDVAARHRGPVREEDLAPDRV